MTPTHPATPQADWCCAIPTGLEPLEPRLLFSAALPAFAHTDPSCGVDHDHAHEHDPVAWFTGGESALPMMQAQSAADANTRAGGGYDLDEVPALSSLPGSDHTLFLDFNGMTVVGTHWNNNYHGGDPIHAAAFDLDGDIDTFSQQELDQISEVWARVAEDFAPFDINVTTVEPPASDFTQGATAIRVLISSNYDHAGLGGDGTKWYNDAAGVARVGSWRYTSDTPAWVFSNLLLGSAKNVAEAASHEAGHTFGLTHDGVVGGTDYYEGHGSGATSWAPIMGAAYDGAVTQWSRGEYDDADNSQDDLAVITQSSNGLSFRPDDHAAGFAEATWIQPLHGGRSVGVSGVITSSSDVDLFAFDVADGPIDLTVHPAAVGANLDIRARLYDDTGGQIASSSPGSSLGASFTMSLDAGRYYLSVEGTGHGDPDDTGYSDYASLGAYHLVGSVSPAQTQELTLPIAGDANGDFVVGSADLSIVMGAWGQTGMGLPADLNDDGSVDGLDLDMVFAHWGDTADAPEVVTSRVLVPTNGTLGLDWVQPGFDDSGWSPAVPGVGYEDDPADYDALLETHLPGGTVGAYVRSAFTADDPAGLDGLGLSVRYDDGFVAYLNGQRVAGANAPDDPEWDDTATDEHDDADAKDFVWFDLSGYLHLLQVGENTLAVHVMNGSAGSSDLLIEAEVVAWSRPAGAALPGDSLAESGSGVGAPAPAEQRTPDAAEARKHNALAAWAQKRASKTADALAPAPAKPAPKRGTATTPRHVADLLR